LNQGALPHSSGLFEKIVALILEAPSSMYNSEFNMYHNEMANEYVHNKREFQKNPTFMFSILDKEINNCPLQVSMTLSLVY
jgi:hypothetical protein